MPAARQLCLMTSAPHCLDDVTSDALPATTYNQSEYSVANVDDFYDVIMTSNCDDTEQRRSDDKSDEMCRE